MKKKFIISAVATALSVAAIGVSYALYKIEPEAIEIGISTKSTKDVAYSIEVLADVGALSPITEVNNSFTVGGSKPAGSVYTQNIIVGDLSVTMTLPNANYAKALVDGGSHIYLDVNAGDGAGYKAEHANFAAVEGSSGLQIKASFSAVPVYIVGTGGILTRKIAVGGEGQVTQDQYLSDIAGIAASDISMEWKPTVGFDYAYIVGSMADSNWSKGIDKYQMVPNPKAGTFEWMYETTFAEGDEFKAVVGEVWSAGDNYVVSSEYAVAGTVYWNGSAAAGVSLVKK